MFDERLMSIYSAEVTHLGAHKEEGEMRFEGAEGEPADDERGQSWAELVTELWELREIDGWERGVKQNQQLNLRYVINEMNHIFPVKMTFLKQILKYGVKTGKNPLPQI